MDHTGTGTLNTALGTPHAGTPHGTVPGTPTGHQNPGGLPNLTPVYEAAAAAAALEARIRAELTAQFNDEVARHTNSRPKVEPPRHFDAKDKDYSISDFLYKLENYFVLARITSDPERVAAACDRLYGPPLTWFRAVTQSAEHQPTWADIKSAMLEEFTPPHASLDARDQLARLRMEDWKLRAYNTRFRNLCLRIPDLAHTEKFDRYCRGLRVELLREVRLRGITSLEQAMTMAEHWVSSHHSASSAVNAPYAPKGHKGNHFRSGNHNGASGSAGPAPMELGAASAVSPKPITGADAARLKKLQDDKPKLTDSDRTFLREHGCCFFCRKPGHVVSACPSKNSKGQQKAK